MQIENFQIFKIGCVTDCRRDAAAEQRTPPLWYAGQYQRCLQKLSKIRFTCVVSHHWWVICVFLFWKSLFQREMKSRKMIRSQAIQLNKLSDDKNPFRNKFRSANIRPLLQYMCGSNYLRSDLISATDTEPLSAYLLNTSSLITNTNYVIRVYR